MQETILAGSSEALFSYAQELDQYIKNTSENIWHLINEHRQVGNSWNDRLYEDFSIVIEKIRMEMVSKLEELLELKKVIIEKAQILQELEKTEFR